MFRGIYCEWCQLIDWIVYWKLEQWFHIIEVFFFFERFKVEEEWKLMKNFLIHMYYVFCLLKPSSKLLNRDLQFSLNSKFTKLGFFWGLMKYLMKCLKCLMKLFSIEFTSCYIH
jgi:hypothetical protein